MKKEIVHKELSYKINGLCFQVQNELGRFCREKQYADRLEELLKISVLQYNREFELTDLEQQSPKGNRVDFLIEDKIILDAKAKSFITKDDYFQMQRYLKGADLRLGLIVNFRSPHLKPKRVVNNSYHSHANLHHSCRSSGFATLVSILLVGVIGLAISVSLLLLGLSSSRTSFAQEQSYQAKALTDACAEEALEQIRDSTPFTGSGTLTLGQGSCSYTVTSQGGANRTITASGTVATMTRRARVIINQINPTIGVTSWQEVADF